MTLVAALASGSDISVVGDTRLTTKDQFGHIHATRDLCQKVIPATGWCLVGWSGSLCLGRKVLAGFILRIQDTAIGHAGWLKDDKQLVAFAKEMRDAHLQQRPKHDECRGATVEMLIAWINHDRSIPLAEGTAKALDIALPEQSEVAAVRLPEGTVRRTHSGLIGIGSGVRAFETVRDEKWEEVTELGRGMEYGNEHRTFMLSEIARTEINRVGLADVGTAFQMFHLNVRQVTPFRTSTGRM